VFSQYPLKYDIPFKIINRLKVNNNNLKINDNFKSHIIIKRTPKSIFLYIYLWHLIPKNKDIVGSKYVFFFLFDMSGE
jgi:hypothetical protein